MSAPKMSAANSHNTKLRYVERPTIALQTHSAVFLWEGRVATAGNKRSVIGTKAFLHKLNLLHMASAADDPYADWFLFDIERMIASAMDQYETWIEDYKQLATPRSSRITYGETVAKYPVVNELFSMSPLGDQMLELLSAADDTFLQIIHLHHKGKIGREEKTHKIQDAERLYRSIVHIPSPWQQTGVTRDDFAASNQVAQLAIKRMGVCPKVHLEGVVRSRFAPKLPVKRENVLLNEENVAELPKHSEEHFAKNVHIPNTGKSASNVD